MDAPPPSTDALEMPLLKEHLFVQKLVLWHGTPSCSWRTACGSFHHLLVALPSRSSWRAQRIQCRVYGSASRRTLGISLSHSSHRPKVCASIRSSAAAVSANVCP